MIRLPPLIFRPEKKGRNRRLADHAVWLSGQTVVVRVVRADTAFDQKPPPEEGCAPDE